MPAAITRSNVAGAPATIATRWTIVRTPRAAASSEAGSFDVATDQLAVDAFERGGPARRPHERAHTHAADGQVADDVAPDEAARAGDEDHPPSVKFCQ